MAIKGLMEVTQIETQKGKKGSYIKVHYSHGGKPHKVAVFDKETIAKFSGEGTYFMSIDKPEDSEYWKIVEAEKRTNGNAPVTSANGHVGKQLISSDPQTSMSFAFNSAVDAAKTIVAAGLSNTDAADTGAVVKHVGEIIDAVMTRAQKYLLPIKKDDTSFDAAELEAQEDEYPAE